MQRLPRERVDPLLVRADHPDRRHLWRRPHRHHAVLAARDEEAIARGPGDAQHPVLVRFERRLGQLGARVPQADRVVAGARRQHRAVRAEARRQYRLGVPRQRRGAPRHGPHAEDRLRHVDDPDDLLGRRVADRGAEIGRDLGLGHVERVRHLLLVGEERVDDELQLRRRGVERHVELRTAALARARLELRDHCAGRTGLRGRRRAAAGLQGRCLMRRSEDVPRRCNRVAALWLGLLRGREGFAYRTSLTS
mmetsp:Transcript_35290/g.89580  ORF Transcript_35290/g.89580 Transcript_35290/m.89580 type:complete len:251 (-) Transcript_35290:90-842(-)